MSFFRRATLLLSALSSLAHVRAAPAPQYLELAQKYAPQLRFHKDEKYFPSTVDFFLGNEVFIYDKHGPLAGAPFPLTNENIADLPDQGSGTYITTNIDAYVHDFLTGQNPDKSQPTVYVFIAPKDNGVVDLYYWIFFPYRAGMKFPIVGYKGYHVGDWESLVVRTVNGLAESVEYRPHGESQYPISWAGVLKFSPWSPRAPPNSNNIDPDARPVAYVARGTHGMWSGPGNHTWSFWGDWPDETSDGGVYWDTQDHLTAINYPDSYSGSLNWLNYKGHWGNKGFYNCWKEDDHDVCDSESGPKGPLQTKLMSPKSRKRDVSKTLLETLSARDMPSQVLAIISTGNPSYTFYTDATSSPSVAVEQVCASVTTAATGEPTHSYVSSYTYATAKVGMAQYTVKEVAACEGYSFVSSYSIGLCTEKSNCSYGDRRAIQVYSADPAVFGPQEVASAIVHDLDNWVF